MPAPKGHPRWGGRQKGTPNKRTQDVIGRLEALGCDPIEGMALIAMDEKNAPELRGRMYAELAQFVAPKLKAIEHSGDSERTYVARLPELEPDLDKWQQQHEQHAAPNGSGVANGNGSAH